MFFSRWKKLFSRAEWQMRLLGLKVSEVPSSQRGLILIQIDGLSHPDFEQAMKRGHLPFLKRLLQREHYRLWPLFSGVPSNTPSFQGEFFFGEPQCVPSFQYWDRTAGKVFTMYEKAGAGEVERRMLEKNEGLIAGGSAYCNIFSGGAAESHICAATAGLGSSLKAWNPYSVLISFLFNPIALIRGVLLCMIESILAFIDSLRGAMKGESVYMEMMFIFTRVLASIAFRDIATAHAEMDIYRGLPVVHINYFGYDEQAHRRGPSTRFAYWSLNGIDAAIRRIWFAGHHARQRHYDIWVYSDHGQETTVPFVKITGRQIHQAVQEVFNESQLPENRLEADFIRDRSEWGESVRARRRVKKAQGEEKKSDLVVTSLGPISQVYLPGTPSEEDRTKFAARLIEKFPDLPLIAIPRDSKEVEYMTGSGIYKLPQDALAVLGGDHPYLEGVAEDLACLVEHDNRGDLVIFGWAAGRTAISFSNENGAHAGLGPRETQAFALLPHDVPLQNKKPGEWLRVRDFREAALISLGKRKAQRRFTNAEKFRVLSYNVHSCVGMDGILSVDRIARVIEKAGPDIVALQELDSGMKIQGEDQAAAIAKKLEMDFHFHAVCGKAPECFGNAVFSRYPMKVVRAENLPVLRNHPLFEPRGVLWVELDLHGRRVHILNTHLSLWGPEQQIQIEKLLGPQLLASEALAKEVILCGDFNMTPGSKHYQKITRHFREPVFPQNATLSRNTWTSQWPMRRLDHILVRGGLEANAVALPKTRLETYASDHLPIAVDFELKAAAVPSLV
jgi:endonuclease/exonuclease/phosphatase family metal-dependent hydrolase